MIRANIAGAFAHTTARQGNAPPDVGTDAGCGQHRLEHGSQYNVKWQALSAAVCSLVRHTPPGASFIILNAKRGDGAERAFRLDETLKRVRKSTEEYGSQFVINFDFLSFR